MENAFLNCRFDFRKTFSIMFSRQMFSRMMFIIIVITLILNQLVFPNLEMREHNSLYITFTFTFFQAMCVNFFFIYLGTFGYEELWKRIIASMASFVLGAIFGTVLCFALHSPFDPMFQSWENFGWSVLLDVIFNFIFGTIASLYFYFQYKVQMLSEQLANQRVNEQRLLSLKLKSEMETLRSKVNPHFLFNTLNSISSLVHTNPDLAEDMIQKLANLFRYSLDMSSKDFIPVETEIDIVRNYLEIEKVRLGDRLTYFIECDDHAKLVNVPPFLLQPLVENSIKHGITKHASGGHIKISATMNEHYCHLTVSDNGVGFNRAEIRERFGISGIRERLNLHYNGDYRFDLTTENGTTVMIDIPILQPNR